tara:strand:- start:480 stop:1181 length:702 start_codon:yes stop_codon:yes gene_type:complete
MKFLENGDPSPDYNWNEVELTALGKRALQRLHYSMLGKRTGQSEPAPPIVERILNHVSTREEPTASEEDRFIDAGIRAREMEKRSPIRLVPPSGYTAVEDDLHKSDPEIRAIPVSTIATLNLLKEMNTKLDILMKAFFANKKGDDTMISIPSDKELEKMDVNALQILCEQSGIRTTFRAKHLLCRKLSEKRQGYERVTLIMKDHDISQDIAEQAIKIVDTTGTPISVAVKMLL